MAKSLKQLLTDAVEKKASDLHINAGLPPQLRIDGTLMHADDTKLTPETAQAICFECLSQAHVMKLEQDRSIDLSFQIEGVSRFRANIFFALDSVCGAFRAIPFNIPEPQFLGVPPSVVALSEKPRGLVLVTGQTGSGKSTTLASLIELINKRESRHIVTVEDPIEYMFQQKKALINQRELGSDTPTFSSALKYVLRQDPDVVLIGEMRDLETVQSAITVAETGHLVFATLHTNSAVQTIDRIIDVFPPHHQQQVRTQLSFILEGIVCQQLIPKIGGGRVLALDVMFPNTAIRNLIREGKTHQLSSQMQMGQEHSAMFTMDQSLATLAKGKIIELEEARKRCLNIEEFENYLKSS